MSLFLLLTGCWPDIRGLDYVPWDTAAFAEEPKVVHEDEGGGVTRTVVDASSSSSWVYVDLDEGGLELEGNVAGWDLGFSRQRIKLDGGVSGDGGVEVAVVDAATLAEVTAAPADGFVTDLADDEDENAEPEYAFDVWFDYDSATHVLTPADKVFVVRTTEARLYGIEILSYYDAAGSSGVLEIRWKRLSN